MGDPARDPASAEFFDAKYEADRDPWRFADDPYELGRYRTIVDHIDPLVHRRVYEPGCSVGVLTEMLGSRCDHVDATDLSGAAVALARQRCAHLPGVEVGVGDLSRPPGPPGPSYDLIVLSEVGYYQPLPVLERNIATLAARIRWGGRLIAAHWIGSSPDHRLSGDEVHDVIARSLHGWVHPVHEVHRHPVRDGYRLDVWDRP